MDSTFILILAVLGLLLGVFLLFGKSKIRSSNKMGATIVALALLAFSIWGLVIALPGFTGTATVFPGNEVATATVLGALDVKLSGGLSNATATEDYYNDDEDFVTFYSADANIADGEEYSYNATIERTKVTYAGAITVTCTIPDKEISGVTADNLAEKTAGKIDLDLNDGGNFVDDNTVKKIYSFAEGTSSTVVEIAFDAEETYHDGMVDLDDYVDMNCVATGDAGESVSWTARFFADS